MKYFAYGSNMNQEQMNERCPESRLIGKAVLKDYKIAFTIFSPKRQCGCADVIPSKGSEVWGIMYEVTNNDLKNLDMAENHPDKYRRTTLFVFDDDNKKYSVEIYVVANKESDFIKPSDHYIGLMKKAAKNFSFPDKYRLELERFEIA